MDPCYGARILDAARDGKLEDLRKISGESGDIRKFRRTCEVLNDQDGWRALHFAAGFGWIEMCKFLIEEVRVDVDIKTDSGITPLLLAIDHAHIDAAKYFINHDADVKIIDSEGLTSLHYAARKENMELMELLLLKGVNIEAKSIHGTPLQVVTSRGNVGLVKFLLAHGATPDSVSELTASPLKLAISANSFQCFKLLLRAGADPNLSSSGITPLAYAAKQGAVEFLRALLEAGADPNRKDARCLAPIEYAGMARKHDAVRILFPVTNRIHDFTHWSIDGIIEYLHTEQGKRKMERIRTIKSWEFKQRIRVATVKEDFHAAIKWCSVAIRLNSSDTSLFLHRSTCFSRLNEPAFAIFDAKTCVKRQPNSPQARYIEGLAWWQLGNYRSASCAFREASMRDPHNLAFENAFKASILVMIGELYSKYPTELRHYLASMNF